MRVQAKYWLEKYNFLTQKWDAHPADASAWYEGRFETTYVNGVPRYTWIFNELSYYRQEWNLNGPGYYRIASDYRWFVNNQLVGQAWVRYERSEYWTVANTTPYPTVSNTPAGAAAYCYIP
jgi:hypothetical protein